MICSLQPKRPKGHQAAELHLDGVSPQMSPSAGEGEQITAEGTTRIFRAINQGIQRTWGAAGTWLPQRTLSAHKLQREGPHRPFPAHTSNSWASKAPAMISQGLNIKEEMRSYFWGLVKNSQVMKPSEPLWSLRK